MTEKKKTVGVIGLGYVGIPSALAFSEYFNVIGIQRKSREGIRKVEMLNRGELPITGEPEMHELLKKAADDGTFSCTHDINQVSECDLICVDVQTKLLQLQNLYRVIKTVVPIMKRNAAISIESTVPPGTTDTLIRETGASIVHAPERISPGRSLWNIRNYDRIIGGRPGSLIKAVSFYSRVMEAGQVILVSPIEAEIIKTAENAVRDVQIAVSNQLALYCEEYGANFYAVKSTIDSLDRAAGAESGVGRCLLEPGAGVGGHCLTKDSALLEHQLKPKRSMPSIFRTARCINNAMPDHMIDLTREYPGTIKKVAVLGLAYKPDIDDTRESPALKYIAKATHLWKNVIAHDPFIPKTAPLETALEGANVVALFTAHTEYRVSPIIQDPEILEEHCGTRPLMVVDGRAVISDPERFFDEGVLYRGIGRGDLNRCNV